MSRKVYHVTPSGDAWRVQRVGAKRAANVRESKADAIARAKELAARGALGEVRVHRRDGEIQMEWTYGKDPRRTRG
jgi:hypothetical protein